MLIAKENEQCGSETGGNHRKVQLILMIHESKSVW